MLPKFISAYDPTAIAEDETYQARWNRMTDAEKRAQIAAARRAVASHIAPIVAQVTPEAAATVKVRAYTFSMASRPKSGIGWIANVYCDGDHVKTIRANSERRCNTDISNWIYRERNGLPHPAARVAVDTELATARRAWQKAVAK